MTYEELREHFKKLYTGIKQEYDKFLFITGHKRGGLSFWLFKHLYVYKQFLWEEKILLGVRKDLLNNRPLAKVRKG